MNTHLIEVAFRGNRKAFFQWEGDVPPPLRAPIIVEADRGEDLGTVHAVGELAEVRCRGCSHGCGSEPLPTEKALRLATPDDVARSATLPEENETARRQSIERVRAAGLVMKISDAEWQWDRRKLTLFFTAEKRVDFRALVRELASLFRTRIELKQIGVRDEAKRLSGVGRCGREYCSASWLPELRPVNLGVAKDQRLSLNPTQISGACGRLMCCLRYEHEFYVQSRRRFPKEGKILQTKLGEEKVIASDIFRDRVTLRNIEGDVRIVPLAELKSEMEAESGRPLAAAVAAVEDAVSGAISTAADVNTAETDAALGRAERADHVDRAISAERTNLTNRSPSTERVSDTPPDTTPASSTGTTDTPASASDHDALDVTGPDGTPGDRRRAPADADVPADGERRRKRRRGRRGGRRLREERDGRATNAAAENDEGDADLPDDDETPDQEQRDRRARPDLPDTDPNA